MKRKMLWGLLVSLIVVSVLVAGCSKGGSTSSSSSASSPPASTQSQGYSASSPAAPTQSQGTMTAGDQWPSQIPPDVPKFTYGTITQISTDSGGVMVWFKNVTPDCFVKYQNDLKNAGWTITDPYATDASAENFSIMATKGNRMVLANTPEVAKFGPVEVQYTAI